ncbi:MAG: DUF4446 family protein [Patescibacteria group bacterium]
MQSFLENPAILVLILALIGWNIFTEWRLKRLTGGKIGNSLEGSLSDAHSNIQALHEFERLSSEKMTQMDKRIKRSIQGVETIRFNAFSEGGGQSFSSAFLDENGDGVVISALYSRDRVSVFAKSIKDSKSTIALSPEESQAVVGALVK